MNKLFKVSILLIMTTLFSSCATMSVYVNQDTSFSKKNPVTIYNTSDLSGALGELQFALQSNGYRIMSLDAAKKALNLDTSTSGSSTHSEITSTTTVNSVYVIKMDYVYYQDINGYCFKSFSATITDLETGEIIMTSKLNNNGLTFPTVSYTINQLVQEMNKVIK